MSATYLLAGASSLTAIETARLLQARGHKVIGISTKEKTYDYDNFYKVENYRQTNFPKTIEEADGMIYFPGTINLKPFNRFSEQEFKTDYDINVWGAIHFIQAYLPVLKKSTHASIVLISSVAAQTGMPFHSSIAMAKGAIESLTKSLAAEFAPGIRVNAIAPSLTATPLAARFTDTSQKMETAQNRNPLKKVGTPTELAEAISFLLTPQSAWITGQVIAVDGGMGTLKI